MPRLLSTRRRTSRRRTSRRKTKGGGRGGRGGNGGSCGGGRGGEGGQGGKPWQKRSVRTSKRKSRRYRSGNYDNQDSPNTGPPLVRRQHGNMAVPPLNFDELKKVFEPGPAYTDQHRSFIAGLWMQMYRSPNAMYNQLMAGDNPSTNTIHSVQDLVRYLKDQSTGSIWEGDVLSFLHQPTPPQLSTPTAGAGTSHTEDAM